MSKEKGSARNAYDMRGDEGLEKQQVLSSIGDAGASESEQEGITINKQDKAKKRGSTSLKDPIDDGTSSEDSATNFANKKGSEGPKEPLLSASNNGDDVIIPLDSSLKIQEQHECEKPVSEGGLGYDYTRNIYTVPKLDEKGKMILDKDGKIVTHRAKFEVNEIREAVNFARKYLKGTTTRGMGGKFLQFFNNHESVKFVLFFVGSVGVAYTTFHAGNLLDWNYCPEADRACRQSLGRVFFNVGLATGLNFLNVAQRASTGLLNKVQEFTDLYAKAEYLQGYLDSKHPSKEGKEQQEYLRVFGEYVTLKIATEFLRTLAKEQSVKGLKKALAPFSNDDITKIALHLDIGYKEFQKYLTSEINGEAAFIENIQGAKGQREIAEKFVDYCVKGLVNAVRKKQLQDSYLDFVKGCMGYKTFQTLFSINDIKYLFAHAAGHETLVRDGKLAMMESADFLKSGEKLKASDDSSASIPLDAKLTAEQLAKLAKGEGDDTFKYYGDRSPNSMNVFLNLAAQYQYDLSELHEFYGKMTTTINPFAMNELMRDIAKYALQSNTRSQIRLFLYDAAQFATIYTCAFFGSYAGRDYTEMETGYATIGVVATALYLLNRVSAQEEFLKVSDQALKKSLEAKINSCAAKKMIFIDKETGKASMVPFMMHILCLTAGVHINVAEHFHVSYKNVNPQVFLSIMNHIFEYYEEEKELYYVMEKSQVKMLIPEIAKIVVKSCSNNLLSNWSRCHWSIGVVEKISEFDKVKIFEKIRASFLYTENSYDIVRMLELSEDIGESLKIENPKEMLKASIPGILMYKVKHSVDNIKNDDGTQKKECVTKILSGLSQNVVLLKDDMKPALMNYVTKVCEKVGGQSSVVQQQSM